MAEQSNNEINAYDKPVLILQGEQDKNVEPYAERAAEAYKDAEYHLIKGAGHGFSGANFEEAFSCIEGYLTRIGIR
ncbi:MAG: alpha/beta hydrolase [Lachnospiraceae bacterium]|nr:alpha/beta hydrolase [Lachnospiraceae bacterium]